VSADEVRASYESQNIELTIALVEFPVHEEEQDGISATEEEIKRYYDENQDAYKQPEMAAVEVVKIDIVPSARDRQESQEMASMILDRILAGDDFGEMADVYSEAPTAVNKGLTGPLYKGQREDEYFAALEALAPGEVSKPVETEAGFYILKKIDEPKGEEASLEYSAQEILFSLAPSRETYDSLATLAGEVHQRAQEIGLKAAAEEKQLEFLAPEPFARNFPIQGLGFVPSLGDFAFANEPDQLSRTLRDDSHYYVARIAKRIPESVKPLDDVRDAVERVVINNKMREAAERRAAAFRMKASRSSMAEAAKAYERELEKPEPFRAADNTTKLGRNSTVARAALALEPGMLTPPIEWRGSYYVAELLGKSEFNEEDFLAKAAELRGRLMQQKINEYTGYWYEKLRAESNIEDYRQRL